MSIFEIQIHNFGEIAEDSKIVIREFPEKVYPITKLLNLGVLSPHLAAYLWFVTEMHGFVMITGMVGTNKKVLLGALLSMVRPGTRICTVEDKPELELFHSGWIPLYGAEHSKLVKFALRSTKCRVLAISDVRGEELQSVIHIATTGHACIAVLHASSLEDMIARMINPPFNVDPCYIRAIWAVALVQNLGLGGEVVERVRYVWEVLPEKPREIDESTKKIEILGSGHKDEIWYKTIFEWDPKSGKYVPDTAEEIVRRSYRIKLLARLAGLRIDDVVQEIDRRARFLEELARKELYDWKELHCEIERFYSCNKLKM